MLYLILPGEVYLFTKDSSEITNTHILSPANIKKLLLSQEQGNSEPEMKCKSIFCYIFQNTFFP